MTWEYDGNVTLYLNGAITGTPQDSPAEYLIPSTHASSLYFHRIGSGARHLVHLTEG
jgi:hypothetical protein